MSSANHTNIPSSLVEEEDDLHALKESDLSTHSVNIKLTCGRDRAIEDKNVSLLLDTSQTQLLRDIKQKNGEVLQKKSRSRSLS